MDSQTEEIKSRIDIVEFIGQYVQLKKSGINHKGLCPFHNEKTPSFMVNGERQIYKCFGCGEGGDIFDFVQKIEGLDFYESLKYLAERAGVTLKTRDPQKAQQAQKSKMTLLDLNRTLVHLYHQLLLSHKAGEGARNYIKKRKISEETINQFQIGYAPNNIARVKDYLHKMGFADATLAEAGNPERFRDRLMFPIADTVGNIVGFSGRALQKDQEPKYLNTRETPAFHKSKVLYGFDLAKKTIREKNLAIIVEGQMDVVSSHQAGVTNAVATSGTALTEDHLLLVRRQTPKIAFAFDADSAGFNTTLKSLEMAWRLNMEPSIVEMPEGCKDAGEAVEKDPALWSQAVEEAKPAYDWLWDTLSKKYPPTSTTNKKELSKIIIGIVASVADPVERDDYILRLSKNINIGENAIRDGIKKISSQKKDNTQSSRKKNDDNQQPATPSWLELLALMNLVPEKIGDVLSVLQGKLGNSKVAAVYDSVFKWYNNSQARKEPDFLKVLPYDVAKKIKVVSAQVEAEQPDREILAQDIDGRLEKINQKLRDKIKSDIAVQIAEAQKTGDIKKVKELLKELQNKI